MLYTCQVLLDSTYKKVFPLIGVDSLLKSLEMIVIAGNSSQNNSVNGLFFSFFFFGHNFLHILLLFCSIIQGGLEQRRKIFADKA